MKKVIQIAAICLFAIAGCKKEDVNSSDFANAYLRMIVLDAPGSGSVQFAVDNKINANGDSIVHNPDGSIYYQDPSVPTTTLINYPSGGWSDNSPLTFAGVYGYYYTSSHFYSYFPNPTDRVDLAPIVNNINFFNWASLPAAQHKITFYSVISSSNYGNSINIKGPKIYEQPLDLEANAVQTIMLVNKAPCKQYTAAGINQQSGFPYLMAESAQYFSLNFDIVSFKDHPQKLQTFKDTCAYVRFMNVTPSYFDQTLNQNTDSIDVYIAPIYGIRPNYNDVLNGNGTSNYVTSIGNEVLVAKGLARFESKVDQPFFEIPLGAYMRKTASGAPDTVGRPRYFRVLAYRAGQSKAKNFMPLAVGDWLSIYNQFNYYSCPTCTGTPAGIGIDSFLLRYDGNSFHPTITTIPIAVGQDKIPITGTTTQPYNYLGYRSIIDYIPVGVNAYYYQQ